MGTRYSVRWGTDYSGSAGVAVGNIIGVPYNSSPVYPKTVGPLTLGYVGGTVAVTTQDTAAWLAGDDTRLRGYNLRVNPTPEAALRIDLPEGAGDYYVWVFSTPRTYQNTRWRINDGVGGTNRFDFEWNSAAAGWGLDPVTAPDSYIDHNGDVVTPIDADMLDPEPTPLTRTFSTGVMEFINGGHSAGNFNSTISAIVFEKITVPLVTDTIRFVPGSVPDPIIEGTSYTLEVEAVDSTQGNARVTSYADPVITLSVDVAVPSGYEISAGDVTQPMVAGLATFTGIVFAAEPPPVTPPPVVSGFSPASGFPGDIVTLTGTGFIGATSVTLGGVACVFNVVSDTTVLVTIPEV
jgi:IPT/TIG domain